MNRKTTRAPTLTPANIRCAIYTRKSSEEGLQQEFNSLHAQRECGEAFVKSQSHEGWECVSTKYDDGGFTGGNLERPALRRLLADIEARRIDCVVVYKFDRLSRSMLDFAKLMELFAKYNVSFVAVTQQINTATSAGRLMMNMLVSFAQFERELVSERTRDKIAAARRKGKWAGGHPILGYDVDPERFKLIVNEKEAHCVRAMFQLYLDHESLLPVVEELERRGWRNKRWTTRKRIDRGGNVFTRTSLYKLLTNVAYTGKVRYKDEVHPGEHQGIVDPAIWQRVQDLLERNGRTAGALVRNKFGAMLKGIIRCAPCGLAMTPSHSTRHGNKRYRYYVCTGAQKRGWRTCPSKSIPAGQIEQFVVDQIKSIGKDPSLVSATVASVKAERVVQVTELNTELRTLDHDIANWNNELRTSLKQKRTPNDSQFVTTLSDYQDRIGTAERRKAEVVVLIDALDRVVIDEYEVEAALSEFEPLWKTLTPREQIRIVQLLVERVDYDGHACKVAITFRPTGIKTLATEITNHPKERIA